MKSCLLTHAFGKHTLQVEDRVDGDIDGDEEVGVQKSQLCVGAMFAQAFLGYINVCLITKCPHLRSEQVYLIIHVGCR